MDCGIKLIAFLLAASVSPVTMMAAGGTHRLVPTSRSDSVGTAYTPEGIVKIEIREIHIEAGEAKNPRPLSVLVLFEPVSGAFSWRVADTDANNPSWSTLQFKEGQAAFVRDGEIVDFWAFWHKFFVRAYRGRAFSIDDAEAEALKAASESINPLGSPDNGQDVHEISLATLMPDFMTPLMNVVPPTLTPKVIDVRWDGDKQHWIVTLKAQWTEEITLDVDYKLISMRKVK
jgi:hypothetical protein